MYYSFIVCTFDELGNHRNLIGNAINVYDAKWCSQYTTICMCVWLLLTLKCAEYVWWWHKQRQYTRRRPYSQSAVRLPQTFCANSLGRVWPGRPTNPEQQTKNESYPERLRVEPWRWWPLMRLCKFFVWASDFFCRPNMEPHTHMIIYLWNKTICGLIWKAMYEIDQNAVMLVLLMLMHFGDIRWRYVSSSVM